MAISPKQSSPEITRNSGLCTTAANSVDFLSSLSSSSAYFTSSSSAFSFLRVRVQ